MLRLTGILIGSALAIAVLIVALGIPQLAPPGPVAEGIDPAPTQPAPAPGLETPAPAVTQSSAARQAVTAEAGAAATEDPTIEAIIDQVFEQEASRTPVTAPRESVDSERWYAFWSPFRSEIAANGFIAKLQESTGIDYRVVKVKTGVYEVAFAYTDDAEIETKLERIANATGLDMSGT